MLRSLVAALLLVTLPIVSEAARTPRPHLSTFWDEWAIEVDPLLSDEEKALFAELGDDRQREAFLVSFWESRGPEAIERWRRNKIAAAQLRPRSTWGLRAVLLFGKPAAIDRYPACGGLRPLQVWRWEPWQIDQQGGASTEAVSLVLSQESRILPASYVPWDPAEAGKLGYWQSEEADLRKFLAGLAPSNCLSDALHAELEGASSLGDLRELMAWPEPSAGWTETFRNAGGPSAIPGDDASLEITYLGFHGRHTIVQGALEIDRQRLLEIAPGQIFDRVAIVGDIWKNDYLIDTFSLTHHIAGAVPGPVVELDLFRRLRPGRYRMELRVEDRYGLALLRTRRDLDVPRLQHQAPPPAGRIDAYERLTREEVVVLDTFPSVEVLPVTAQGTSRAEIYAITTGGPIAAVSFLLDGQQLARVTEAPYLVEVDVEDERRQVTAIALDREGRPLAEHTRWIEPADRPFGVRLAKSTAGPDRIPVMLNVPTGEHLHTLQCYDGRLPVETLDAGPYTCPIPERQVSGLRYARVVATLTTGEQAEHIRFFGPHAPDQVDVRLAELYVSVFDGSGRPVSDLTQADFRVLEEGLDRRLERVESLSDLPMSVAVLMDLSSSMGRLAHLAAESAERFFSNILIEDDLASLLAFNDDFHRLVPFTGEIRALRHGAVGVRALGSTRLNDAVVWALSQYPGQQNRRALVVLSDGADVGSDFPFEQVVTAAVEAGVAVYPISLVRRGEEPPAHLDLLAARTGGTRFVVRSIDELDEAYARIEKDLRSQYLLVYRLDEKAASYGYRPVEVEILQPGLTTRNVHGYYR